MNDPGQSLNTEVIDASTASIARAARLLARGGVVAFPTDTVYGLGARADHAEGVDRVFLAKGRSGDKALILLVSDVAQARAATRGWDDRAQALADAFWPGPLSIVLTAAAWVVPAVTAGNQTVAVRVPDHHVARAVISACQSAIAAPSANRAGAPPPTTAAEVVATLGGRIPLVIDGGETTVKTPSTLISLVGGPPRVLRAGSVSHEQLRAVLPSLAWA